MYVDCLAVLNFTVLFQMLDQSHNPDLSESGAGLDELTFSLIKTYLSDFLRVEKYSWDPRANYKCFEESQHITTLKSLRRYMNEGFLIEADLHRFLTFDLEGSEKQEPMVLIVMCLGAASVVIHLHQVRKSCTSADLKRALGPFIQTVFSGQVCVLGLDIGKDLSRLLRHYAIDDGRDLVGNVKSVEISEVFNAAKKTGVYNQEVIDFIGARTGLGFVSLCCNGFNFKPFSYTGMRKYLKHGQLDATRKTVQRVLYSLDHELRHVDYGKNRSPAPIFKWEISPLTRKQLLYCHLDVTTPFRLLLDFTRKIAEQGKLDIGKCASLTKVVDLAIEHALRTERKDEDRRPPYKVFSSEQLSEGLLANSLRVEKRPLLVDEDGQEIKETDAACSAQLAKPRGLPMPTGPQSPSSQSSPSSECKWLEEFDSSPHRSRSRSRSPECVEGKSGANTDDGGELLQKLQNYVDMKRKGKDQEKCGAAESNVPGLSSETDGAKKRKRDEVSNDQDDPHQTDDDVFRIHAEKDLMRSLGCSPDCQSSPKVRKLEESQAAMVGALANAEASLGDLRSSLNARIADAVAVLAHDDIQTLEPGKSMIIEVDILSSSENDVDPLSEDDLVQEADQDGDVQEEDVQMEVEETSSNHPADEGPLIEILTDSDLREIGLQRASYACETIKQDRDCPNLSLRERYRLPNFRFDAPSERVAPWTKDGYLQRYPENCRHRVTQFAKVPLTLHHCNHCGKHHDDPQDCAIARYHAGSDLYECDRKVLEHFPCTYCGSCHHSIRLCDVMHAYCKHCRVRGHRPIDKRGRMITRGATKGACYITPEGRDEYEARFARMASWGLRTTATGGRWGLRVSDEHRCSPTGEDWSDTDEE